MNARKAKSKARKVSQQSPLDASMGYLIRRTFRSFTRALEQRLAKHGISISMWFFLRLLWESDGRTQKEICFELQLSPPTTVSAMDNLEARGLIIRRRSPIDKRQVHIYLTATGKKLKGELEHYANEVNTQALRFLKPEEIVLLRSLLMRVNESLKLIGTQE
jgi:DNA-binding MarR family transcriptional regulator